MFKVDFFRGLGGLEILLFFDSPLKHEVDGKFKDEITYPNHLQLPIPNDKQESIKKAFLRLSEIAKEENKDPFKN